MDKEKLKNLDKLPPDIKRQFALYMNKWKDKKKQTDIKGDFMAFVKHVWPDFIEGRHHKDVAKKFNDIANGKTKRVIINMAPRHTKSEFASYLLPAWMVGRNPKLKIIQSTNTTELSVRFGRKAKALMDTPEYKEIFKTRLKEDSQAAGKWETQQGGEYYAAGVGSAITGRGADLLIIDDPHTEQDAMNAQALDRTYEWYTSGPRQRLQPGGTIIIVMTRWNEKDLTGRLMKAQKEAKADQWEVIEFPAILPSGDPLWPEYWNIKDLEGVRASIPLSKWNAQYMQNPTGDEGALIKREWWKNWEGEIPPLEHVIQSYDTAFMKKETADYSAITTWGVFTPNEDSGPCLMLVDSLKGRYEFPELRRVALEQYGYWQPETVIIEGKASGLPLTYELRKAGIPVINFTPSRGNDKHTRVNSVSPLFESGKIYAPADMEFAQEVIEECAAFPYGDHDDLVDSMTQAVMRFRQGGLIEHPDDYEDEPLQHKTKSVLLGIMAIDENEQRLKDQLRMIEMGETLEDLNDPEEYEDQGGINSLRKAPSIKLASETGAEEFELELSTVIAEYNDLTSKGDPAVRGISLDQFIDNYFSKKKMMKMMEEDRATVMGGGMMRTGYGDGTPKKKNIKDLNVYDVVDQDKEDEYYKIKEEKMLRKYYPQDYPPSQRTMGMEELRKMINKAEKDKKKLAMGGIAGVL